MKVMDFSINTLTLFGITLATGLVVDDAIVVVENIARLMEERKLSAFEAAREGMKEVTGAVIATALVLAAVFYSGCIFPGTTGQLYRQFALTLAISVTISAFNALTLTPALSALLLKNEHGKTNWFFAKINWFLDQIRGFFRANTRNSAEVQTGRGRRLHCFSRTDRFPLYKNSDRLFAR